MLIPIEDNVYDIPQRLKEYEPTLSLFFETDSQEFQVWQIKDRIPQWVCSTPNTPDDSLLKYLRASDNHRIPFSEYMRKIYDDDEKTEREREKRRAESTAELKDGILSELRRVRT